MVNAWSVFLSLLASSMVLESAAKGRLPGVADQPSQEKSVASLRARGPDGLNEALRDYDALQARCALMREERDRIGLGGYEGKKETLARVDQQIAILERRMERMTAVVDDVGGQRSCAVSRLYWYTDLEEAKTAAGRTGRPILSLRMLGKLTDEYSCANSRFFRTALYSNNEISDYLRDHYVLHWQSVRPVPRVTIDFGDGRKLERTLTGNSAHYVLASRGQPLDVLPGLYGPQAFGEWLERLREFHARYAAAEESQRIDLLAAFHRERRADVYRQWASDVKRLGEEQASAVFLRIDNALQSASAGDKDTPMAAAAARLAETKTRAETPLLRFANFSGPWIEHGTDDELWRVIANLHRDDVRLDEASIELMRREFPRAALAGRLSVTKSVQEDPVLRMVRLFESSMALDTIRNEYLLHRRIHEQFVDSPSTTADIDTLNEWVYAELFLTPSRDPWLSLAPRDVYTALENDGRVEPAAALAGRPGNREGR